MKVVNGLLDILSTLNVYYNKGSLTKEEYDSYDDFKDTLIENYYDKDSDNDCLIKLLNALDFSRIRFLGADDIVIYEDAHNDIRTLIFNLIYQNKERVNAYDGVLRISDGD